jgi:hypothetical protein
MQMDETTQQNAALVEEAAAASESMEDEAGQLNSLMHFFKIDGDGSNTAVLSKESNADRRSTERPWDKKSSSPAEAHQAVAEEASKPAPLKVAAGGGGDEEWEDF